MKRSTIWILAIVVAMLAGLCIVKYNALATNDQALENAWAPLQNILRPRYDAVPKYVNEVILYTGKGDSTTKSLSETYKEFQEARNYEDQIRSANRIEEALSVSIIEAGQRYPGIASHYQFMNLKAGFQASSVQIQPLADAYNSAVDRYNTYVRKFPNDLVALILGFQSKAPYFMRQG
jgi:LemA protein